MFRPVQHHPSAPPTYEWIDPDRQAPEPDPLELDRAPTRPRLDPRMYPAVRELDPAQLAPPRACI